MFALNQRVKGRIVSSLALVVGLFCLVVGQAQSQTTYVEGQDYIQVAGFPEDKQPMVREFFSYNCPHCYRQDETIHQTIVLLGDGIHFERTPVGVGRKTWVMSQQAYHLGEKFGLTEQVHKALFKQIQDQRRPFSRTQELRSFFAKHGVSKDDFDKAVTSVDLKLALRNYDTQTQLAQIRGVPSLLVNGKYLIKSKSRSSQELAELIRYLKGLE